VASVERGRDCCAKTLSRLLHRAPYRAKRTSVWHLFTRFACNLRVHDEMTGLLNRRQFNLRATRELSRSSECVLVFFDLDRLAHANSVVGHQAVDACIIATARIVEQRAAGNLVARYGGGNFAVLTKDWTQAGVLINAVRSSVALAFCTERSRTLEARKDLVGTPVLTISVGAAAAKRGERLANLVQRADMAMFEAKSSGRNCVRWAPVA
jgi:diguanylate cyclase (GGDEF)-like protein